MTKQNIKKENRFNPVWNCAVVLDGSSGITIYGYST